MADFQWREKVKKIANTAESGQHVPEQAKSFGIGCFYVFFALIILLLLFLAIGFIQKEHYIVACIVGILCISGIIVVRRIISADQLPK
ncbi:hypothetical protein JFL43_12725 [Viridibacillus sp. YIM B01967]|uniref:Uncharacterized protein n=1 Tax=Viridibacillus soli TaxID=2798301 RepID=A0ABS1H9C4_9BACL|nr:hypothetical protein [Viridibacillus soli]MBK3495702.1 hypothetical protein [Viridibacillus soli]